MRNIYLALLVSAVCVISQSYAHADTVTQPAVIQAGVNDVFSIEFYTAEPAKILYTTNIPFTNIDTTKSECYADGRAAWDGKSDTGVVCKSNMNVTWYLKMGVTATSSPAFPLANFKFYIGQPWNLTLGKSADGSLAYTDWSSVPTAPTAIYTAGPMDKNNMDSGTLATLSFKIIPTGLTGNTAYSMNINYTLTTSP